MKRIYLDHAATSWPKPEAVYAAIEEYQRHVGASAGRGAYASGQKADAIAAAARLGVAQLLGEAEPTRIAFTTSGTDSLSTAIFGLLRGGEHVLTTVCEHNAVLRPLAELAGADRAHPIRCDVIDCDASGYIEAASIEQAMRDDTRLVVVSHASNVTGVVQDVRRIAQIAHERGALVLLDAAQTVGKIPVDVEELGIDLLAAPGHKGLLGPQGVGVLWLREGVEAQVRPLRYGGVAIDGGANEQPAAMPYRYEAGTLNIAGIAGLGAGVAHLLEVGVESIGDRLGELTAHLIAALEVIAGVRFLTTNPQASVGVVSFNLEGYDPHEAASLLEQIAGVECRAGLHCAPRQHAALGSGGAVRLSIGSTTSQAELNAVADAVRQLAASPLV